MPEHPFAAAAEGLPKFSRRRFLAFTGSATVATAGTAEAKVSLGNIRPQTATPGEDHANTPPAPDRFHEPPGSLAELGNRFDAALAALAQADNALDEAVTRYERLAPELPGELVAPPRARQFCDDEPERDALEKVLVDEHGLPRRRILPTWALEQAAEKWPDPESHPGNHVRFLLALARQFEADQAAARAASGLDDAWSRQLEAQDDVFRIAEVIHAAPATGFADLFVKARALAESARLRHACTGLFPTPGSVELAQAMLGCLIGP